jgi:hypothetical protein
MAPRRSTALPGLHGWPGNFLDKQKVMQSNNSMTIFADYGVLLAYVMTLLAFLFCVIYGILNWKKGLEEKDGDYREEIRWEKEEIELIERLP